MNLIFQIIRSVLAAPHGAIGSALRHKDLLRQFTIRNITGRYKNSFLGLIWAILNPLMMLAVYTYVFSMVFKAKWGQGPAESKTEFALTLFAGLIVFNIFSEVLGRSSTLILDHPNYVKKVVFPLDILPLSIMGEALFHACMSLIVLAAGLCVFAHGLPWTFLLFPLACLPLLLLTLGLSWILASVGVFVRDVGYSVGILLNVLFFMTPIFYPLQAIPEDLRGFLQANPLAVIVHQCRQTLIWNQIPDWLPYLKVLLLSLILFSCGYAFFKRTQKAFADVI